MRRRRLLVVGPLPPPVGGVETVTKAVLESRLKDEWQLAHCDLTKGRAKTTQGKFDLGNFGAGGTRSNGLADRGAENRGDHRAGRA